MSDHIEYTMYKFYLKKTKELYAYTIVKEYKKRFSKERNLECFYTTSSKLNDIEFMIYNNMNSSKKLIPIVLTSDGKDYMEIIGTQDEEERMFSEIEQIYSEIEYFRYDISNYPFKKRFIYLLNTFSSFDTNFKPMINSLAIFSHIYRNTFVKEGECCN